MVHRPTRRDADLIQPTVFLLVDLVAIESAFLFSYWLRFYSGLMPAPLGIPPLSPYLWTSVALLVVWAGIFYAIGSYDPVRSKSMEDDLDRIIRGVTLGSLIMLSLAFFIRSLSYSRLLFLLFAVTSVVILAFGRMIARRALRRWQRRGQTAMNVLFVGSSPMRQRLEQTFAETPGLGLIAVGRILDSGEDPQQGDGESEPLGTIEDLERIIDQHRVDLVLITLPFDQLSRVARIAERIGERNVDVQFVPDMQRLHVTRMRLREIAGIPFISVRDKGLTGMDRIIKRAFDLVVTVPLLVLLSPVLLGIALLVRISSPGPVLYRQSRLGRDNRAFDMLKFRTMRVDAESESGPVWTVENDPRRTAIGSFLRRFSLDELPQLLNVIRGQMSLVGPRPEREIFAEQFHEEVPRYLERHRVRSGITGWAQVHGLRGNTPIEVRTLYDLYYVENWSVALDLRILLMTVIHVLRGENAY
jgi:exopolysaccharide biosynthesis polyprenyl glycosylphosphotransferase